jgi:hypothetical protein
VLAFCANAGYDVEPKLRTLASRQFDSINGVDENASQLGDSRSMSSFGSTYVAGGSNALYLDGGGGGGGDGVGSGSVGGIGDDGGFAANDRFYEPSAVDHDRTHVPPPPQPFFTPHARHRADIDVGDQRSDVNVNAQMHAALSEAFATPKRFETPQHSPLMTTQSKHANGETGGKNRDLFNASASSIADSPNAASSASPEALKDPFFDVDCSSELDVSDFGSMQGDVGNDQFNNDDVFMQIA